mmetsp:Transcript_21490/g.47202  ORF Transcript_21490/g.47202 Transcript_21490/m.47202 type:complete len:300 (-) Transcript_21490:47-946(-)
MKPQRAFVFVSAAITAATGVAAVIAGRQASNDLIMSAVEPTMASTVVFLGLATICAGVVGLCGGCSESRCGVLFFPSCTLLIGVACIIGGGIVLSQANGDGGSIEEACWTRQKTGDLQFQKARTLQDDFDSLQTALANCRKSRPEVLSLRDCGQLAKDDAGIWYKDRPRKALVEWLEEKFSCGGFCAADTAVFGYPWQQPRNGSTAVTQSNKNTPRDPCFTFLAQELAKRGSKLGGLLMVLQALVIVSVCGALWLVCSPPPSVRHGSAKRSDWCSWRSSDDESSSYEDDVETPFASERS